jgi:hypothetical protein
MKFNKQSMNLEEFQITKCKLRIYKNLLIFKLEEKALYYLCLIIIQKEIFLKNIQSKFIKHNYLRLNQKKIKILKFKLAKNLM